MKGFQETYQMCCCYLRACTKLKSSSEGKRIHAYMITAEIKQFGELSNNLLYMYGRCGSLEGAESMFDKMPHRDVVSWNNIVAIYAQLGAANKAIFLLKQMQEEGLNPNKITYTGILKSGLVRLAEGRLIHALLLTSTYDVDISLGNLLLNIYSRCGSLRDAQGLFNKLLQPDVSSWNILITAYAQDGHVRAALCLWKTMHSVGVPADEITYVSILNVCSDSTSLQEGVFIHASILVSEIKCGLIIGTALLNMYRKCGGLSSASYIFEKLHHKDVVTWSTMIATYAEQGLNKNAVKLFHQMQSDNIEPNRVTLLTVLDICSTPGSLPWGISIHARILKYGHATDVVVGNALVNMYGKCGFLKTAEEVFTKIPELNVISWTSIISAYGQQGHYRHVLQIFDQMQQENTQPDNVTFVAILDAFSDPLALPHATFIHACLVRTLSEIDTIVGTAIVNMYNKCGNLVGACKQFDQLPRRNVISWTSMITSFNMHGYSAKSIQLFFDMLQQKVVPNKVTFTSALDACSVLSIGMLIHAFVIKWGVEHDVIVGTALINMYGICGVLDNALSVFFEMPQHDSISWSAIIVSFAHQGHANETMQLFQAMCERGVLPNSITLVAALYACGHTDRTEEAYIQFISMSKDWCISPSPEHYHCMVDLIGRPGWLDEGEDFINNMPSECGVEAWRSLLAACRIYGEVLRGNHSTKYAILVDQEDAAAYVLLSSIFAADWNQDELT